MVRKNDNQGGYFPIFLEIRHKNVLVIGGGVIAQRKIESLMEAGANIVVASKDLTPQIKKYEKEGRIVVVGREYDKAFLEEVFMVIAATDDAELNHRISQDAIEKGLLVNAVDQPKDCNFIFPSVVKRGDLVLAISTSGKSPALAKKIRERLEQEFGDEYEIFLNIMGYLRQEIFSWNLPQHKNSQLFGQLTEGDLLEAIHKKKWDRVTKIINQVLNRDYSIEKLKTVGEGG
jgi:precorrin-2 dehydrogenase/sirohydrochlorin ferrochelatase